LINKVASSTRTAEFLLQSSEMACFCIHKTSLISEDVLETDFATLPKVSTRRKHVHVVQ